jgi:hypothetical protein
VFIERLSALLVLCLLIAGTVACQREKAAEQNAEPADYQTKSESTTYGGAFGRTESGTTGTTVGTDESAPREDPNSDR